MENPALSQVRRAIADLQELEKTLMNQVMSTAKPSHWEGSKALQDYQAEGKEWRVTKLPPLLSVTIQYVETVDGEDPVISQVRSIHQEESESISEVYVRLAIEVANKIRDGLTPVSITTQYVTPPPRVEVVDREPGEE